MQTDQVFSPFMLHRLGFKSQQQEYHDPDHMFLVVISSWHFRKYSLSRAIEIENKLFFFEFDLVCCIYFLFFFYGFPSFFRGRRKKNRPVYHFVYFVIIPTSDLWSLCIAINFQGFRGFLLYDVPYFIHV